MSCELMEPDNNVKLLRGPLRSNLNLYLRSAFVIIFDKLRIEEETLGSGMCDNDVTDLHRYGIYIELKICAIKYDNYVYNGINS